MANCEACCSISQFSRVPWICVSSCILVAITQSNNCASSFYFPGILVGPYLEFANYRELIDGSVFKIIEKEPEARRAAVTVPGRLVPRGRKRVAYRKLVTGLLYLGLFVFYGGQYNYGIAVQDWFANKSIFYRYEIFAFMFRISIDTGVFFNDSIAIFQLCGVFERMKYYAIWTLTEVTVYLTTNLLHLLMCALGSCYPYCPWVHRIRPCWRDPWGRRSKR